MADPDIHGSAHRQAREEWAKALAEAGSMPCSSPWCRTPDQPITPSDPWDLGHAHGRRGYAGPQHPGCNRATRTHAAHLRARPPEPHPGALGG